MSTRCDIIIKDDNTIITEELHVTEDIGKEYFEYFVNENNQVIITALTGEGVKNPSSCGEYLCGEITLPNTIVVILKNKTNVCTNTITKANNLEYRKLRVSFTL